MKVHVFLTTEGGLQAAADKMREISKRKDAEPPLAHLTKDSVSVEEVGEDDDLMQACWDLAHDINASMGQPAESDVQTIYDFVRGRGGR